MKIIQVFLIFSFLSQLPLSFSLALESNESFFNNNLRKQIDRYEKKYLKWGEKIESLKVDFDDIQTPVNKVVSSQKSELGTRNQDSSRESNIPIVNFEECIKELSSEPYCESLATAEMLCHDLDANRLKDAKSCIVTSLANPKINSGVNKNSKEVREIINSMCLIGEATSSNQDKNISLCSEKNNKDKNVLSKMVYTQFELCVQRELIDKHIEEIEKCEFTKLPENISELLRDCRNQNMMPLIDDLKSEIPAQPLKAFYAARDQFKAWENEIFIHINLDLNKRLQICVANGNLLLGEIEYQSNHFKRTLIYPEKVNQSKSQLNQNKDLNDTNPNPPNDEDNGNK